MLQKHKMLKPKMGGTSHTAMPCLMFATMHLSSTKSAAGDDPYCDGLSLWYYLAVLSATAYAAANGSQF